ncbi:sensor histidine kinase [Streptomyces megasporus]|uniref:sensor histidine kinase n=1 Tax=Streptomyces megasporus TaxID=44060 RepID=UPI000B01ED3D|nr:ATP-binding protein [Streptomyces megasporus]
MPAPTLPGSSGPAVFDGAPSAPPAPGRGRRRKNGGGGTAREGGRRARRPAGESSLDAALRRRMVRLAVLPAALIAVAAAAVIAYVLRAVGGVQADSATVWGVLGGALLLGCAVVVGAALFASSEARAVLERYAALRHAAAHHQAEIQGMMHRLEQGEWPRPPVHGPLPEPDDDPLSLLVRDVVQAQRTAELSLVQAVALVRSNSSGSEEKVEVFVNLARRLQSLVHREIELLDELENEVEDPDLLKGLFHVDHLATRIRRHAENLAVLGGAVSRRQWSRPVTMTEVLRSAIAEVEQYPRVKLVPPIEGTLRGHAVADVIHLLAELVENATEFSAPNTQVLLRAQRVTAGLAVEVEDRGLGMTPAEQNRMNGLLADPERVDVAELLQDGRIGLFVVSALARRHNITVQLQTNIYGGTQAVLILPDVLLGDGAENAPRPTAAEPAGGYRPLPPEAARAVPPATPAPPPAVTRAPEPVAPERRPTPPPTPRPVPSAATPAAEPASAGAPHAALAPHSNPPVGVGDGDRPQLPRRRRQEHLVPELRQPQRVAGTPDGSEAEHNPGLMAAFRRGASLAEEADDNHPR